MQRVAVGVALALGVLVGCGMAPPVATASDATRANLELADLQQGRTLLLGKCGSCHRPPLPAAVKLGDWPHELDDMAGRAKLSVAQRRLIEQYLITMVAR